MHFLVTASLKLATTPPVCPVLHKAVGTSIFGAIARPIAAVLAGVYSVVPNYAVAILALSALWMIIIAPLTLKSTRSMLAMQKLQPELKKLQAEHKNDRQAFAQAQMDLFKQHNVSPFGSCLPMLLPLPVFFALFRVIDGLSHVKTIHGVVCPQPDYLSPHTAMYKAIVASGGKLDAFGFNLAKNALSSHSSFLDALPYFILLLVMIGTSYVQTARMMSRNPANANNPQTKFMKYVPILFGVIFIRFPAGVILYYAMSNVCRIIQQEAMYLFDPKVKALATQEAREVRTEINEIERERGRPGGRAARSQPAEPTPAPRSRFRDLLTNAMEQQQRNSARPGASEAGRRPVSSGGRPGQKGGPGGKGGAAAKGGAGAKGGAPAKAGTSAKAGPPAKGGARPGKGAPAKSGASVPARGAAGPPSTGGAAAPVPGQRPSRAPRPSGGGTPAAASPRADGVGNGAATSPPSGTPPTPSDGNGNGAAPPVGSRGATGGRTGATRPNRPASQNRKRRSR
ncbi:MAG TPA: membrane protein insertase YidC [Acidimicrobiales bacterium]|nr:membrane protein insertase YidC [Acidimicrobiales bacterium]